MGQKCLGRSENTANNAANCLQIYYNISFVSHSSVREKLELGRILSEDLVEKPKDLADIQNEGVSYNLLVNKNSLTNCSSRIRFWDLDDEKQIDFIIERVLPKTHIIFAFYRVDDITSYNAIKNLAKKISIKNKKNRGRNPKHLSIIAVNDKKFDLLKNEQEAQPSIYSKMAKNHLLINQQDKNTRKDRVLQNLRRKASISIDQHYSLEPALEQLLQDIGYDISLSKTEFNCEELENQSAKSEILDIFIKEMEKWDHRYIRFMFYRDDPREMSHNYQN